MRRLVIALALLLTACGGIPKRSPLADVPPQQDPDPLICADLEDAPRLNGGVPEPVTEFQRNALMDFLRFNLDDHAWGVRGWDRAALAKRTYCR